MIQYACPEYFVQVCFDFRLSTFRYYTVNSARTCIYYSETSDKGHSEEDKPPNKGQAKSTLAYTLKRNTPLKEDNLSTKDKTAGPDIVLIKRFHCIIKFLIVRKLFVSRRLKRSN